VLISLQDANLAGFDTVLLRDVSTTVHGDSSQKAMEAICEKVWGCVSSSEEMAASVTARDANQTRYENDGQKVRSLRYKQAAGAASSS
jgi:hypothetical protein